MPKVSSKQFTMNDKLFYRNHFWYTSILNSKIEPSNWMYGIFICKRIFCDYLFLTKLFNSGICVKFREHFTDITYFDNIVLKTHIFSYTFFLALFQNNKNAEKKVQNIIHQSFWYIESFNVFLFSISKLVLCVSFRVDAMKICFCHRKQI